MTEEGDYIFGFGSIINPSTHDPWLSQAHPATDSKQNDDDARGLPGRTAVILAKFGYQRGWNFRSNTGFTALGIRRVVIADASDINGVVFQIHSSMLPDFDRREVGYDRVQIPMETLQFTKTSKVNVELTIPPSARIWVYVPMEENFLPADEDHPILQSYVDTVMQGCLFWGEEEMAESFVRTTAHWSPYFLNDTPSSRRPWLYRQQYTLIDEILKRNNSVTHFTDRRHPEEFASAFLMKSMRGAWSIPRRNTVFTGREKEVGRIHDRMTTQRQGAASCTLAKLEVCGMGGVGKTQICTEYCYRYFPSYYGLVIWLQAPSAESVAAGYRQLMADTNGGGALDFFLEKDTDEIVAEVKARLFRSTVPWLLVFDNLEDYSLLEKFVPNGGPAGHVLITTRLIHTDSVDIVGTDDQRLILGCFNPQESVKLICRAAGEHNVRSSAQVHAAKLLAEHLGHLPLALGMAAAYMHKCDVDCAEYLTRYYDSQSPGGAQHLGHEAVSSSLSLSLKAIKMENPAAWEALQLLGWMGPDQITKNLFRALFVAKNTRDKIDAKRNSQSSISVVPSVQTLGRKVAPYAAVLSGGLLASSLLTFTMRTPRRSSKVVAALLSGAAVAFTTKFVLLLENSPTSNTKTRKHSSGLQRIPTFSNDVFEQTDMSWTTLKSFSLLVVKKGSGSIHRLLAQAVRVNQTDAELRYYLNICVQAVLQAWAFKAEQTNTWQESTSVLEHAKNVVAHSVDHRIWTLDTAVLSKEAGLFSAMALSRFEEAQVSLEQSLRILNALERSTAISLETTAARAATLHELGKVMRYEGNFTQAEEALTKALQIRKQLARNDLNERRGVAATLHELGVLEVRKRSLDSAASFLQQALDLRRVLERELPIEEIEADCASTLYQFATVQVARKPPCLDLAESLLTEALSLKMQIGQRAATLKQLARVAIRRGKLDIAERRLAQALELYVELYGENTFHINVAAVKSQQGSLAFQREHYEQAWDHFTECLRARRHIYAYSQGNHLDVSTVLHELGCVAFAQKRFDVACELLTSEKIVLNQLHDTSSQREQIVQALLTNLSWLRKCAKERGDEDEAKKLSSEHSAFKRKTRHHGVAIVAKASQGTTLSLQRKALRCRLVARQFALAKPENRALYRCELDGVLTILSNEVVHSPSGFMRQTALEFTATVSDALFRMDAQSILKACDNLRDVLRDLDVQVHDAVQEIFT